jgi:tripartite-type tricarboxylate transporter receptor subunit TctC
MTRLAALAIILAGAWPAAAQPYPNKPIHMIVGFAAGGGTDIAARMVAQKLSDALGQPVIIDNRPGAGGTTGNLAAAKASPDGYTLLMTANGPHAIAPSLYKSLPYDVFRDYAPIALVAENQYVLVVHPSVPANSVQELIAWARAQKEPPTYSSAGIGTPAHLAAELFASMAEVKLLHVPVSRIGTGAERAAVRRREDIVFGILRRHAASRHRQAQGAGHDEPGAFAAGAQSADAR